MIFKIRPSLQPLAWVLLCTQVPALLLLAVQGVHHRTTVLDHLLRGLLFGLFVLLLWFIKERSPIGYIKGKAKWAIVGVLVGFCWGVLTAWLSGGDQGVGGVPMGDGGLLAKALIIVSVGLCFPFFEELLFRGIVIQQLRRIRGSKWFLISGSSALFLLVHLAGGMGWMDFFEIAAAGITLAWLAIQSQSLWPAIFLHSAYNLCLVLIAFSHLR